MFWKKIPKTLTPLTDDPWTKLRDKTGAFFLSGLMLVTVAVLVGTSFVPGHAVEVWMVTAPAGVIAFLYNVVTDMLHPEMGQKIVRQQSRDSAAEMAAVYRPMSDSDKLHPRNQAPIQASDPEKADLPLPTSSDSQSPSLKLPTNDESPATSKQNVPLSSGLSSNSPSPQIPAKDDPTSSSVPPSPTTLFSLLHALSTRFPSTTHTLTLLPIPLLPFAMAEFILVRGLSQRGWIHVFATGFARACTSPAATVFFFGFVSAAFLCPLAGTNIGATIILVEIMRDEAFMESVNVQRDRRVLLAAVYSVAMGSNIGAFSYTFAGSLAGLLWKGLLADKGVRVSQWKFAKVNALPLLMQIVVSCAIVLGEVYWFA